MRTPIIAGVLCVPLNVVCPRDLRNAWGTRIPRSERTLHVGWAALGKVCGTPPLHAVTAGTTRDTHSPFASPSEWDVPMPIVALRRPVGCRMAVHASWAFDHSGHFAKNSARPHRPILN